MRKLFFSIFTIGLVFTACKKADFDDTVTGEAVGSLTLLNADTDSVSLNPATPDQTITFNWTAARPGVNSPVKYRLITALRSAENFDAANRVFTVLSDNAGSATTATLTYKQIEDLLKASSISNVQRAELKWTVEAFNEKEGSALANSSGVYIFKRASNGATPFHILGPSTNSIFVINPNSTSDNLEFNWTRSYPATGSPAIQYVLNFYANDGSTSPVFTTLSDNDGADTLRTISHKAIADSLVKYNFPGRAELRWNVTAISGTWREQSDYTNQVTISRLISYTFPQALNVAGNHQNWTPATAPQVVSMNNNGEYEGFIHFSQPNPTFKFVKGDDWSDGELAGSSDPGKLGGGNNLTLPDGEGVYLIRVNSNDMTWSGTKITTWGLTGSATPLGWPPGVPDGTDGHDHDMTFDPATGLWSITLDLSVGEIKFRANNGWALNIGDNGADGIPEIGGSNISIPTAGNYTITLDLTIGGNWAYRIKRN